MPTVSLRGCTLRIGRGVLQRAPVPPGAVVLTDRTVAATPAFARLRRRLKGPLLTLAPGESAKSPETAARVWRWLAGLRIERGAVLVGVGGGVVTDLAGFVAATYLRGIACILVPTTLLAQVDAAVGGKTGVNLPEGKNLVGCIAQPREVWIDPALLASLPERAFRGGLAEVVKAAVIADAAFFRLLERNAARILARDPRLLETIVARSVRIKASVVARDERESGLRAVLNYGHTIGHALEAAGGFRKLQHGEAVSAGMEAEARLAERLGMLDPAVRARQGALLEAFGLPRHAPGLPAAAVLANLKLDKKVRDGRVRFALPERIGKMRFPVVPSPRHIEEAVRWALRDS